MSKKTIRDYTMNEAAIVTQLQSIVCGRFEWSGLPERLTSIQLERFISLWDSNGLAVGFSDPTGGPMILPGYPSGDFDVYWLPRSFTVTGALFDRVIDGLLIFVFAHFPVQFLLRKCCHRCVLAHDRDPDLISKCAMQIINNSLGVRQIARCHQMPDTDTFLHQAVFRFSACI